MPDTDKTEKVPLPKPLPEEGEEEMGKTMMDIDSAQFRAKGKEEKGSAQQGGAVPQESVDDLLKKKRSLKERLGRLFGKK